jgi:hypothetical protein
MPTARDALSWAFVTWCLLVVLVTLLPTAAAVVFLAWAQRHRMTRATTRPVPDLMPVVSPLVGHLPDLHKQYGGDLAEAVMQRHGTIRSPVTLLRLMAQPALVLHSPELGRKALETQPPSHFHAIRRHVARIGPSSDDKALLASTARSGLAARMHAQGARMAQEVLEGAYDADRLDLLQIVAGVSARGLASALGLASSVSELVSFSQAVHNSAIGSLGLILPPRVVAAVFRVTSGRSLAGVSERDGERAAWRAAHGLEPLALTLFWCLHDMAHHPEASRHVLDEIAAYPSPEDATEFEPDLRKLRRTQNFVSEVLRVHAPVPLLARSVASCTTFPLGRDVGEARPGTMLIVPVHAYHHAKEHWNDPFEFRPDRFDPSLPRSSSSSRAFGSAAATKPWQDAYMPFGTRCPFAKDSPKAVIAFLIGLLRHARPHSIDSRIPVVACRRAAWLALPAQAGFNLHWYPVAPKQQQQE